MLFRSEQVKHICEKNNIEFTYTIVTMRDLQEADAMFLTSTAGNAIRVSMFEHKKFDNNETLKCIQNNF